jgi:hypothetical protein
VNLVFSKGAPLPYVIALDLNERDLVAYGLPNSSQQPIRDWCITHFGREGYGWIGFWHKYCFAREEDALAFLLRWQK